MTMHRRQRSDSIAASVAAYDATRTPIEPPEPLPAELMGLWRETAEMRAVHEWSPMDLRLAVMLVRALGDLESEQKKLVREPKLRKGLHGLVPNPRMGIVERLSALVLKLQTRLLLTSLANGLKTDRVAKQRALEKEMRMQSQNELMDLLCEPIHQDLIGERLAKARTRRRLPAAVNYEAEKQRILAEKDFLRLTDQLVARRKVVGTTRRRDGDDAG